MHADLMQAACTSVGPEKSQSSEVEKAGMENQTLC
jgi:hypothetical protein